jgi:hypothetical protein
MFRRRQRIVGAGADQAMSRPAARRCGGAIGAADAAIGTVGGIATAPFRNVVR